MLQASYQFHCVDAVILADWVLRREDPLTTNASEVGRYGLRNKKDRCKCNDLIVTPTGFEPVLPP